MKPTLARLCLALSAALITPAFVTPAFAQGEVDPSQSKALPSKPATKEEKAKARTERRAAGAAAAKTEPSGDEQPANLGTAKSTTPAERKAARAKRRAAAAEGVKKGEIRSPGEATAPELQKK